MPAPAGHPRPRTTHRRILFELAILATLAALAPTWIWDTVAVAVRDHPLLRAETIAVGATAILLWVRRIDIAALRQRIGAAADHRLSGDPATAPPPSDGYTHYLPCALYVAPLSPRRRERGEFLLAPGVLYSGPAGLRFEPRRIGHRGTPAIPSFSIGPIREVTATAVRATRCVADALAGRHFALHIRWPGKTALFRVPSLAEALPGLHARLDELKYGAVDRPV